MARTNSTSSVEVSTPSLVVPLSFNLRIAPVVNFSLQFIHCQCPSATFILSPAQGLFPTFPFHAFQEQQHQQEQNQKLEQQYDYQSQLRQGQRYDGAPVGYRRLTSEERSLLDQTLAEAEEAQKYSPY